MAFTPVMLLAALYVYRASHALCLRDARRGPLLPGSMCCLYDADHDVVSIRSTADKIRAHDHVLAGCRRSLVVKHALRGSGASRGRSSTRRGAHGHQSREQRFSVAP